jgi:homoserine kinase type II
MSVFAYMRGREVAVFEVSVGHCAQVGRFLADLHRAGRGLGRRRRDRYDAAHVHRLLTRCSKQAQTPEHRRDIDRLHRALGACAWPVGLPRGTIHGDLCIDHVRFEHGALCGVLDFACASSSLLLYDVALALVDWAFVRDAFCPERACALVDGYVQRRVLSAAERQHLYTLCCLAAVRYAASRLQAFELLPAATCAQPYRDYRHFMARLQQLHQLGPQRFEQQVC